MSLIFIIIYLSLNIINNLSFHYLFEILENANYGKQLVWRGISFGC